MFVALIRLAVITAALLLPSIAKAQSCGDTLYADTTLQSDIRCPVNSAFGLRIAAPNVTLDLNGFSIIVPTDPIPFVWGPACVGSTTGVEVIRASGVSIRNGRIIDNGSCRRADGIHAIFSDATAVYDLEFDTPGGVGIEIIGSRDSSITQNRFLAWIGVTLWASNAGRRLLTPDRTLIRDNIMPATNLPRFGLVMAYDSDDTTIANNLIEGAAMLVHAVSGSDRLQVFGNDLMQNPGPPTIYGVPAIFVQSSLKARIQNNTIVSGAAGMVLEGDGHVVLGNHVEGMDTAIELGRGTPASGIRLSENYLTTTNNGTGLWFWPAAISNDGSGNTFGSVTTPVRDQGAGNVY